MKTIYVYAKPVNPINGCVFRGISEIIKEVDSSEVDGKNSQEIFDLARGIVTDKHGDEPYTITSVGVT